MATKADIAAILEEARAFVSRNVTDTDMASMQREWERQFQGTSTDALTEGFRDWKGDTDREHFTLPKPGVIWKYLAIRRKRHETEDQPSFHYQRPRPEFVEAHKQFHRDLAELYGIEPAAPGRFDPARLFASITKMRQLTDQERAERRAKLQDLLDALPKPLPDSARSTCKGCDGSGWQDTDESYEATTALAVRTRTVRPCEVCNRDAYRAYKGLDPDTGRPPET